MEEHKAKIIYEELVLRNVAGKNFTETYWKRTSSSASLAFSSRIWSSITCRKQTTAAQNHTQTLHEKVKDHNFFSTLDAIPYNTT